MRYFFLLFFFFFGGCSSVTQTLDTTTQYMKDVPFTVNGTPFVGVGVAPKTDSYKIVINYPYGNMDVVTFDTCSRNIVQDSDGKKLTYLYTPSLLESRDSCGLEIGIYNKKSKDGWALLQFEKDSAKLQATVECNGSTWVANGVSLCQAKVGTIQRISFSVPTVYKTPNSGCKLVPIGNSYEYNVIAGYCYITFMDDNENFHNHTIYGGQTFIIRQ